MISCTGASQRMLQLYGILSDVLEFKIDEVSREKQLKDIETWDSVAMLSLIAVCEDELNLELDITKLSTASTIDDLVEIMGK